MRIYPISQHGMLNAGTRKLVHKKRALVLTTSNASRLARVMRNVQALHNGGYIVDIASPYHYDSLPVSKQVIIDRYRAQNAVFSPKRLLRAFLGALSSLVPLPEVTRRLIGWQYGLGRTSGLLSDTSYEVLLVEEVELLPFALSIGAQNHHARVIVDLRDFNWTRVDVAVSERLANRRQRFIYRHFLRSADAILVVSEGQRRALHRILGLTSSVLLSAPWYHDFAPRPPSSEKIRLVHHGNAERIRGLEMLIEAMRYVEPRFELHLYIVPTDQKYYESLVESARHYPNVWFHSPVQLDRLVATLNMYDIGVVSFPPTTLNLETALPNKVFEFIQARLGIVCGPAEDIARLVSDYGIGAVAIDFNPRAIASAINNIGLEDVWRFKMASDRAARTLCFEEQVATLHAILGDLA